MYKEYYIREEEIELLIDETQYEGDNVFEFSAEDNKKSFVDYGKEKGIRKEYENIVSRYRWGVKLKKILSI